MNKLKRINKLCLYCHQGFSALKKDIKRGYGKYCSRNCANRSYQMGRRESILPVFNNFKQDIAIHCNTCTCNSILEDPA